MRHKRKKKVAQIKIGKSVVTISPGECAEKEKIDKEAREALEEIGRIATTDKKLTMRLRAVRDHLTNIMADHHHK
jgi:hypothetical protein